MHFAKSSISILKGSFENQDPTITSGERSIVGVFCLTPSGVQALVRGASLRKCVDFIELCEEELGLAECYILVPKQITEALPAVKFLSQCLDAEIIGPSNLKYLHEYDVLDWYICKCEL